MPKLYCEKGYFIQLANGQGWHIIATEGVRSWVNKLASIMELSTWELNRYPMLIFIRSDANRALKLGKIGGVYQNFNDLPNEGWKVYDVGMFNFWFHSDLPHVICEHNYKYENNHKVNFLKMWFALYPINHGVQEKGGLSFHAGLVEWNGRGVLLVGPGKIGKSTCCRRIPYPWQALCDDETLIVRDDKKRYLAHPFPTWSDYLFQRSERTWNVQRSLPLSGIFFLEQAETDKVIPIMQGHAAILINQSVSQMYSYSWKRLDREEERMCKKKFFHNACELAKTIPAFILRVSLTGQFWVEMEKVLSKLPVVN